MPDGNPQQSELPSTNEQDTFPYHEELEPLNTLRFTGSSNDYLKILDDPNELIEEHVRLQQITDDVTGSTEIEFGLWRIPRIGGITSSWIYCCQAGNYIRDDFNPGDITRTKDLSITGSDDTDIVVTIGKHTYLFPKVLRKEILKAALENGIPTPEAFWLLIGKLTNTSKVVYVTPL